MVPIMVLVVVLIVVVVMVVMVVVVIIVVIMVIVVLSVAYLRYFVFCLRDRVPLLHSVNCLVEALQERSPGLLVASVNI